MPEEYIENETEHAEEQETAELDSAESGYASTENGGGAQSFNVRSLVEWAEMLIISLVSVMLVLTFIGRHSPVIGSSMEKTLLENDVLIISNLFYTPKRGDIVVFASETTGYDRPYVKRVIATEGQTIDIDFDSWTVYIDGEPIDEPYVNRLAGAMHSSQNVSYPYTVSDGCIFVMGDNRNMSTDSRVIGEVDVRSVMGRVICRVFPLSRIGTVE